MFSENAGNSLGTGRIFVGQTCQNDSRRALIQFDLSSIPAGSTITEATITLGAEQSGNQGADTYNIFAVTTEWGEGFSSGSGRGGPAVAPDATWTDAMFGTAFWNNPGGDFDATLLTSRFINETSQPVSFPSTTNMIDQAQTWTDDPTTNFGIIIIGNESVPCSAYRFGSKEIGVVPTLTISYEQGCTPEFGMETYNGCKNDGYSVSVGGTTYNESNPSGMEILTASNGCDSTVTIDLIFGDNVTTQQAFIACEGSGLSVQVNGTLYNEDNPIGIESLIASNGCDSIVMVELTFIENVMGTENYEGCEGDGYSVSVNGTIYNENNPTGQEELMSSSGCDSTVMINLFFGNVFERDELYAGCAGDGYSVTVGGIIFNENNPAGMVALTSGSGCDSIIIVSFVFGANSMSQQEFIACEGSGLSIQVNGTLYNEDNPSGIEDLTAFNGCDSTVTIDLTFIQNTTGTENYEGCQGDGYSVLVNGTTYNENNPAGQEILMSSSGCDSIVTVDLSFDNNATRDLTISRCTGDGYMINVNGTVYSESNPTGMELLVAANGCDSIINVELIFGNTTTEEIVHRGCIGDGFTVTVNNTVYDEDNPTGMETLTASAGCDSIVTIDLFFGNNILAEENYNGCSGDGYTITAGGLVFNEENPGGTIFLEASNGCDSILTVNLFFLTVDNSVTINEPSITATAEGTYQWIDCDNNNEPLPGETNQTFIATRTGNYAVQITQNNCTVTSNCNTVTVVNTENTYLNQQVNLFPNPTSGRVQMTFGDLEVEMIKLRDITGKVLLEVINPNAALQELNIPGPAGVYLLEVQTPDASGQFRLIKQ